MKKYLMGFLAVTVSVALSAFTYKKAPKSNLNDFYWYTVDYSVPGGRIPSGASPEFGGSKISQSDAEENDICLEDGPLHCLRGFLNMPTLPTTTFDESTPKNDD